MKCILRCGLAAMAIAGLLSLPSSARAERRVQETPAQLIIEDNAKLFSEGARDQARTIVSGAMGVGNRQVHVETYESLTPEERKQWEAAKDSFWNEWAKAKARGDRGIEIIICKEPRHIHILADKQMRDHGFGTDKDAALKNAIVAKFKTGDFDGGLLAAAEYTKAELPKNVTTKGDQQSQNNNKGGTSVGTWICIGLCVLLGIWLVIGLIRAFSGAGGAGGAGGGGGFLSGLLGGLFGAMAGMWMYNTFFGGHHDSGAFGGDSGGDYGGGDTGAGDYGDSGTGGDWGGDAGGGGGDWGGGGGDW